MSTWKQTSRILAIRPDNLGDVLMTQPALRALKSRNVNLTLLTSEAGAAIARLLPEVDEVLPVTLPWVKADKTADSQTVDALVREIAGRKFDGAVVFTNFSQNPMPSVLIAYLAGIPLRLSYMRENPYRLLTDWIPDTEPFTEVTHGIERQLALVRHIGATTSDSRIRLPSLEKAAGKVRNFISGIKGQYGYIILHPGASEEKRRYPSRLFGEFAKLLSRTYPMPVLITGSTGESELARKVVDMAQSPRVFNVAGKFSLPELIELVRTAALIVSNNTGPVHIAEGVDTPVIVLYAQTNPEHTPRSKNSRILPFPVPPGSESSNTILRYLASREKPAEMPTPGDILGSVSSVLGERTTPEKKYVRQTGYHPYSYL